MNLFSKSKGLFSIAFADIITAITSALFWLYLSTLLSVESYGELFYLLAIANVVLKEFHAVPVHNNPLSFTQSMLNAST